MAKRERTHPEAPPAEAGLGSVADLLVARLAAWGVRRVFAAPGPASSPLAAAFARRKRPLWVPAPDGALAAEMARAHAATSGEVAVCACPSGREALALAAVASISHRDHEPIVVVLGPGSPDLLGDRATEDFQALFEDAGGPCLRVPPRSTDVSALVDRALRTAIADRGVVALLLPEDAHHAVPAWQARPLHEPSFRPSRVLPQEEALAEAADILNAGERVAMIVGGGAVGAARELSDVALRLGAGVAKDLEGKAALPDHLPCVTGPIGRFGTRATEEMLEACDTLLVVGSRFCDPAHLPPPGRARGVQIDLDVRALGAGYPMQLDLLGSPQPTLAALVPLLTPRARPDWTARIHALVAAFWAEAHAHADPRAATLAPTAEHLLARLARHVPDDAIVCADEGAAARLVARDFPARSGMTTRLGCISAVAAACGARWARPTATTLAFVTAPGATTELAALPAVMAPCGATATDAPFVIVLLGVNPEPRSAFLTYAAALGIVAIDVPDNQSIDAACARALSSANPVLLTVPVAPVKSGR